MPRILPFVARGATLLVAAPAAPAASAPDASALAILRIGPATGRVVVKIKCTAKTPFTGQYTITASDGDKLADGGFGCDGPSVQYAYATVIGSATETPPGSGPSSRAIAKADRLTVQLRKVDAEGHFERLGDAKSFPVEGWLLNTDVTGADPSRAVSHGATGANHAPTLVVSATPASLERCAWKVLPVSSNTGELTSDADGDSLTLTWYADGKKLSTVPLKKGGTVSVLRHTFAKLGVHKVKVVARDGHGATTQQTLTLTCYSSKK